MSETPYLLRRIAGDSSLAFFSKLLAALLGFLTNLVMARLYGAETMGIYFIVINLLTIASAFCCLGLDTGLLRFTAALKADGKLAELRKLLWPSLGVVAILGWLAAASIYGFGDWLAERFHSPNLTAVLNIMVLALPVAIVSLLLCETIRALGGVRWVIIQQHMLTPLIFLILLLILAQAGHYGEEGSRPLALAYLLSTLLGLIFLAVWPGLIVRQQELSVGTTSFFDLLRYSWPLFLGNVLWLGQSGLDSLILGWFTSPEDVAYFNIAARTAPLVTFPLLAVNMVVPPLFAQFHQRGDLKGLERVSQTTARWMYFVALPLALVIILLAPDILGLFGPNFTKARFALSVLALGQLINVASGSVGFILAMTGQQWAIITMLAITSGIMIPLLALSAAAFGLYGLALVSAGGIAGINILLAWAVWRRLKIKPFAQGVGRANLSGLLGVGLFFLSKPYLGTLGGAACFSLGYLALTAKTIRHELTGILQGQVGSEG